MHHFIYSITATAVYKVSYLEWIFSVLLQIILKTAVYP